jgi:hypothetical protein
MVCHLDRSIAGSCDAQRRNPPGDRRILRENRQPVTLPIFLAITSTTHRMLIKAINRTRQDAGQTPTTAD